MLVSSLRLLKGPQLDAINATLEGIGCTLSSVHDEGVNNTAAIHNHSQDLKDLTSDVVANTISLTDLRSTIADLREWAIEILAQLKTPLQPSPSFIAEDLKNLKMVVEFGVLAGDAIEDLEVQVSGLAVTSTSTPSPRIDDDREGEKNAEDPHEAEGEKEIEKEDLVITDEEDESTFIPNTTAQRIEPAQITTKAEEKLVEGDEDEEDDEPMDINDDGKNIGDDNDDNDGSFFVPNIVSVPI
ncbi:hypothetical protein L6452_06116 [Arctium lappa]|uniref:Uncharacterized protein n=1 Tax=Arctium lappa TaxID=4217 RepID=A0ACB9EHZ4_ARCLA|nr:hypothetical protein L6452_06116 [Arctium lappa]